VNPQADATRLLEQATWGPTSTDIAHVQAIGAAAWLNEQFNLPASSYPNMALWPSTVPLTCDTNCQRDNYSMYLLQNRFFTNALYGRDQLRQRVAFALHELLVVSGTQIRQPSWMTPYLQILTATPSATSGIFYELTLNPRWATGRHGDEHDSIPTRTTRARSCSSSRSGCSLNSTGRCNWILRNPIPTHGQPEGTVLAHVLPAASQPPAVPAHLTTSPPCRSSLSHDTTTDDHQRHHSGGPDRRQI
jgi:hypothetical protein